MRSIVFNNTGEDYSGFVAACNWLKRNGYSFGFMQKTHPIGIMKGKFLIQRWTSLTAKQRFLLDGTIEFPYGNPRANPVVVKLK